MKESALYEDTDPILLFNQEKVWDFKVGFLRAPLF